MSSALNQSLELIKRFEGFRLEAYLDIGGVPTIGYGTTVYQDGKIVKLCDKITQEQAEKELLICCENLIKSILVHVKAPLNDNQLAALTSLVYNIGRDAFYRSTLLKYLNKKNYDKAADEFLKWVFDNNVKIQGLINRRKAEREVFLRTI